MAKRIRDTTHGYVYLAPIEEVISQHPLLLRLHYIHQTSFTYLTYPNAHSTRYPHTLGVMHVAGEIFRNALLNSRAIALREASSAIATCLVNVGKDITSIVHDLTTKDKAALDEGGVLTDALYQSILRAAHRQPASLVTATPTDLSDLEFSVSILLLYQSIRLAALLHDVGHPPFSHIIEYALQANPSLNYPGHEQVGLTLLNSLINDNIITHSHIYMRANSFFSAALLLAKEILYGNEESQLRRIKDTLISGDLDADRLDYVQRDCYAAGLVPKYDIRRLVESAFLHKLKDKEGRERIGIAYTTHSLSSVENFYSARYDLYRWMIFHHDVVRRNLAIQRLIAELTSNSEHLDKELKNMGAEIARFIDAKAADFAAKFGRFIDGFLIDLLWRLDEFFNSHTGHLSVLQRRLQCFQQVVLHRRNELLPTLYKRIDEFERLAGHVTADFDTPNQSGSTRPIANSGKEEVERETALVLLNDLLEDKFRKDYVRSDRPTRNEEATARLRFAKDLEAVINKHLCELRPEHEELPCIHVYFHGTFKAGPEGLFPLYGSVEGVDELPLLRASPTVAMLVRAWRFSPHLGIFVRPLNAARGNPIPHRDRIKELVVKGMREFLAIERASK